MKSLTTSLRTTAKSRRALCRALTRLRRVNAGLSEARLRHARSAVTPTARQPNVRVGTLFPNNQSALRPIISEKAPLNSALGIFDK